MKSIKALVDEYADITRQIKALKPKQAALADQIKSHGAGRREGTSVPPLPSPPLQVTSVAGRKTTNWSCVCAEVGVPPAIIAKHHQRRGQLAAVRRVMNKLGIDAPTKGVKNLIRRKELHRQECCRIP